MLTAPAQTQEAQTIPSITLTRHQDSRASRTQLRLLVPLRTTTSTSTTTSTLPPTTTAPPTTAPRPRYRPPVTTAVTQAPSTHPNPSAPPTTSIKTGNPWDEYQGEPGCDHYWSEDEMKNVSYSHQCWDKALSFFSWPVSKMFGIMRCESKGNPYADNRNSSAAGLLQILGGSKNWKANISQAWEMFKKRGTQPWSECGG